MISQSFKEAVIKRTLFENREDSGPDAEKEAQTRVWIADSGEMEKEEAANSNSSSRRCVRQ